MTLNKKYNLEIYAGPCSLTRENTEEIIHEIAEVKVGTQRAIYGTRVVGLKSRTSLAASGDGMGMDFEIIDKAGYLTEKERESLPLPPSVELAERIHKATGLKIGTEIMIPYLQLPFYKRAKSLKNNLLIWNPAVEQLGWFAFLLGRYAEKNGWDVGIKNGKFLGKQHISEANHTDFTEETSLEKTWKGLVSFLPESNKSPLLIHRGVDVPRKDDFRNALVHEIARRVKEQIPHARLYLDPSHSYGPKLREHIVKGTVNAMQLKTTRGYLYDGILIEAGTSPSDTEQHVTIKELQELTEALSEFRTLRPPTKD